MSENLVACEFEDSTNCVTTLMELKELPVLEEVPEVVVEVPVIVDPVPEELAATGTGDVVVGLLLGLALLTAGAVLFIRGRKNK